MTSSAIPGLRCTAARRTRPSGRATPSSPAPPRRSPTPNAWQQIYGEKAPPDPFHLFRLDLHEVSTVGLNEKRTALVIEVWTPGAGVRTIERA